MPLQTETEDPLEGFPDPIVSVDADEVIVRWNAACAQLFGTPGAVVLGRHLAEVLHLSSPDRLGVCTARPGRSGGAQAVTVDVTRWTSIQRGSRVSHLCLRDATARTVREQEARRAAAVLHRQARSDALTGLANRHEFDERLSSTGAAADGGYWALVVVDLDGFKPINDSLGHAVGDEVLVAVATRLRRCARPQDTVARFGGDEFVLLAHLTDASAPATLTRRIHGAFADPIQTSAGPLRVRASVGIAISAPGGDPGELLRRADKAMYRVKLARG